MSDYLSAEQKDTLIQVARNALRVAVGQEAETEVPGEREGLLGEPGACFVTLYLEGGLRGCIGMLEAKEPLHQAVRLMTAAAALRDPRFEPVTAAELPVLRLSLSVLTPLRSIRPRDVEVGRDGLVISRGPARGVLLPQVATEQNWDAETFLRHTCIKARLPPEAWRDSSTTLEAFSAVVFGES